MKKSTISKEAGSTTFDFLAKKTEVEMFRIMSLIQSNQLYIKDANALLRSHRGKRGQRNYEEFPEVEKIIIFTWLMFDRIVFDYHYHHYYSH